MNNEIKINGLSYRLEVVLKRIPDPVTPITNPYTKIAKGIPMKYKQVIQHIMVLKGIKERGANGTLKKWVNESKVVKEDGRYTFI